MVDEQQQQPEKRMIRLIWAFPIFLVGMCTGAFWLLVFLIVVAWPEGNNIVSTATEVAVVKPTEAPADTPIPEPTEAPTDMPIPVPTEASTYTLIPEPTEAPADTPTPEPKEAPTEAPTATPETQILLSCQDCFEEGILINLWSKPGGIASAPVLVGKFEHLTVCVLVNEITIDDFLYYKVRCDSVEGWLSHRLVAFMEPTDTSIPEPIATVETVSDDCDITELSVWWLVTSANHSSMVEISEDNTDEFRLIAWTAYQIQKELPYPPCAKEAHLLTVDYFINSYECATSILAGDQDKAESFFASAMSAMDELRISMEKLGLEFEAE